jgi:tetratricopeptide (TPR) repeat protein/predicted Ser/Thr protein kinase
VNRNLESFLKSTAQFPPEMQTEVLARECPDPAMRAEVAALIQYADEAESFFDNIIQGAASSLLTRLEPRPGDTIGSYRIVQSIGLGGMGSVYLAERADGEIEHKVAIKLLRADTHRPGWRERFLRERQLLATLHHPSVVHLIDAGHTEDGRPFLVMEHVDGVPIDRYAGGIEIKERLKLFVQVCEGVSHAHRHLIIHRDLKPSNILVNAGGQPKLLDFGIAKLLNDTGDVTQIAEQLLTPNYASPEQLRGEAQSTATDVYSLGSVLYNLLTGAAPREKSIDGANGKVVPPSRVNPEVPGDLDYVVEKALRNEPEHRYGSVDEFAKDVEAVLERRPVQARGGDVWYRMRRYLRRYWAVVAAALLVVISLSAGLWVANWQRRIAERRFTDVRQLADKLFDVDVQVAQLPGSSKARQLIVDTALQYLTRVSGEVRMDPDLALELGTAYMRVARVQGVNISTNLGQTAQAEITAQKAQTLIGSVLRSQPRDRIALLRAGQIAHDRMILAADGGHGEDAMRFAGASVARLNEFLSVRALNPKSDHMDAQQVIIALMNVANQYMKAGQYDEAIRICERAIQVANATDWPTQAGAALMIVALSHRAKGDLDNALRAVRESVRLLEPDKGETRTGRLHPYGLALIREGQILGEDEAISLNRPQEAVGYIELALKIGEDLARRDPGDFQSQFRVFTAEIKLAGILRHNEPARASKLCDDALQRLSTLTANAGTLRHEILTMAACVDPLLRLGRRAEARQRLDGAFERLSRAKQYPAAQIDLGSPADNTLRAVAEYEAAEGGPGRGAAKYDELLTLISASNPKAESRLEDAVKLSSLYEAAAQLHRKAGQTSQAAGLDARRLKLWQQWGATLPNNAFVRRQLEDARPH